MSKVTDREAQQAIDRLTSKLDSIKQRIADIVQEVASTKNTSSQYWARLNRQLSEAYEDARIVINNWIDAEVPPRFNKKLADAIRQLKNDVVKPPNLVDYAKMKDTASARQSLDALLGETKATFEIGIRSGELTMFRLTSATQQTLVSDAAVNKAVGEGFYEGGTGDNAKRRLRDELLKKALDGKYVLVVGKDGKERQYDVEAYAELVARTKLTEVSTLAVLDTAQEVGSDLVQVSSHNTICAVCAPHEGKIFSISGSDPDFPELEDEPPYHPNCQHSLSVVVREALELDGTLAGYAAFSNDEADRPPTKRGFVPVAERELEG